MPWTLDSIPNQSGKVFLVTGSNTGLGFETVRQLAGAGARILMACRNLAKGEEALMRLQQEFPNADLQLLGLDLASLDSITEFSARVRASYDRMDGLINNAGVMMTPFGHTADGFEMQFGTNVLGHFALTGQLLPLILSTPGARVVSIGSVAHWAGRLDFDNLNAEKGYSSFGAYARSKLANIVFAYELQRRLERAGSTAISLATHPGGTQSELGRHRWILRAIVPVAQPVGVGAQTTVRAAVDPQARGGDYFGPSGLGTFHGPPAKQRSSKYSGNPDLGARLWQACERLTGVSYLS